MSRTVREIFHDAIASGNWQDICRVYEAIVGEEAPQPPDILGQMLPPATTTNPLDQVLEDEPQRDMAGSQVRVDPPVPNTIEAELVAPEEPMASTPSPVIVVPNPTPNDTAETEFHLEQGAFKGGNQDSGDGRKCRREPMQIPEKRKNRFRDNGRAHADEKVTKHPNDPSLGIQKIRPRGVERLDGNDTGGQVVVTCGLCGETETVVPRLAVGYDSNSEHNTYRCNSCASPSGRNRALRKQREAQLNGTRR
jgi:hypothetical protein